MNKKVLLIALVLVLSVGSIFAVKKAEMEVGAQFGYGGRTLTGYSTVLKGKHSWARVVNNGFYGAFTFEYGITDSISVKAEAGVNTMGYDAMSANSEATSTTIDPPQNIVPVNFSFFAGALYNLAFSDEFTIYGGVGLDVLMGNVFNDKDAPGTNAFNVAFGVGFEVGGAYALSNQLSLSSGCRFGLHFVNTNENFTQENQKFLNLAYKFYTGLTYSI